MQLELHVICSWDVSRDLVPFLQFKKYEKHSVLNANMLTLLHGCFLRFLNLQMVPNCATHLILWNEQLFIYPPSWHWYEINYIIKKMFCPHPFVHFQILLHFVLFVLRNAYIIRFFYWKCKNMLYKRANLIIKLFHMNWIKLWIIQITWIV